MIRSMAEEHLEIDLAEDAASAGPFTYWVTPFTLISGLIGVALGAVSGYFGGWVDLFVQRVIDVLLAFPAGMVIGYYANARSSRSRGQWRRLLPNGLLAGSVGRVGTAGVSRGGEGRSECRDDQ